MLTGSAVWVHNVRCKLCLVFDTQFLTPMAWLKSVIGKDMGDPEGPIHNFFRWLSALLVRE